MPTDANDNLLVQAVALLSVAVLLVPVFRRLGLGSVLGYLTAGLLVGPYGLRWFSNPAAIFHFADLGVVMFLFVIGLEMRPSRLWSLRRYILGLGFLQTSASAVGLTLLGLAAGLPVREAFIGAMGFALTSTAIVMQILGEQRGTAEPYGQKIVSILLFEDLLIVPLLAYVAWISPGNTHEGAVVEWISVAKGVAALILLLVLGHWCLNPLFRILAQSRVRELLSAGALLVVLGAALLMQLGGMSMGMGAFIAGVLLSESSFRHQLEADIEPFRGILLGLFFLGVGMALDISTVRAHWAWIGAGVLAMSTVKATCVYLVARLTRSNAAEALNRASLMALGGEFAFVLYAAAASAGLISSALNAIFTADVVLSMALGPLFNLLAGHLPAPRPAVAPHAADVPEGLKGNVMMIGFGRFGQVVSQSLLARDVDVTVIDTDVRMIRAASDFGFKIYYGDGTRLDVLTAAGAGHAEVIAVCVDDRSTTNAIVDLLVSAFPKATLVVRTYDREHSLQIVAKGAEAHVRETFESALWFANVTLGKLGTSREEAQAIAADVRRRDEARFEKESAGIDWATAGALSFARRPRPEPLITPRHGSQPLNQEAAVATHTAD
ncbi:monovalent cation:proton antiporter-2 (CPA2) family protein [Bacillus sp. NP157]|nr:monovalent cation:proton antiporter-2 (CPA2) family protein [Bacillus sp. NP157]